MNNEMCDKGATRVRRVGDRGWRWGGEHLHFEREERMFLCYLIVEFFTFEILNEY